MAFSLFPLEFFFFFPDVQGGGGLLHCGHCIVFLPNRFYINLFTSAFGASQMNFSSETKKEVKVRKCVN